MKYKIHENKINEGLHEMAKKKINELENNLLDEKKIHSIKGFIASQLPSVLFPGKNSEEDLKIMVWRKNCEKNDKLMYVAKTKAQISKIGEYISSPINVEEYLNEADNIFSQFSNIINGITYEELREIGKEINKKSLELSNRINN